MSRVLLATVGLALAVSTEGRDAGILYEVWHSSAANTYKKVKAAGGVQLTTELVVRSAGNLTLDDVFVKYGLNGDIFNVQPQLGFYCLYRARPGDPSPPLPDCDNITGTSTAHASMLTQAGFDYVAVDITNWPMNDTDGATDIAVLRPTEVLFEEWSALRAAGTPTPSIALWPCSPAGGTTWKYLLDTLYNDPVYGDLVYKQDGKKVMFIPYTGSCYDPATAALIESNGGRNDVVAIPVWALFGQQTYAQGVYGFFSPCTDATGAYTTSMVGGNVGPCNQFATTANGSNTILEVSASGGYMTSQCALPFASPGHMRGLTLSRLFQKVLATQAPHLFMSSFNEMIGGRQAPASPALIAFNMGLPKDSQRKSVWVDSYAAEFSRDIEPTVEGGSMVWNVAASCVQMYKAGQTCADAPTAPCCTTDDKLVFGNIWSLASTNGTDYLLTPYLEERTALVKSGAWREQCSPIPNPTAFCVDTSDPDGRAGPFILYNTSTAGDAIGIQVIPLYRCVTAASGQHFFSVDAACEGLGNQQTLLGYIATSPGRETLRALYRCKGQAQGSRHHALDLECDVPDGDGTALGYVREGLTKQQTKLVAALERYGYPADACVKYLAQYSWDIQIAAKQLVDAYGQPDAVKKISSAPQNAVSTITAGASSTNRAFEAPTTSKQLVTPNERQRSAPEPASALSTVPRDVVGVAAPVVTADSIAPVASAPVATTGSSVLLHLAPAGESSARHARKAADGGADERDSRQQQQGHGKALPAAPSKVTSAQLAEVVQASKKQRDVARAAAAAAAEADEDAGMPGAGAPEAVDGAKLNRAIKAAVAAAKIVGYSPASAAGAGKGGKGGRKDADLPAADVDTELDEPELASTTEPSSEEGGATSFASALQTLRALSTLVSAAAGPVTQPGLPAPPVSDSVVHLTAMAPHTCRQLMGALQAFIMHATGIQGLLPSQESGKGCSAEASAAWSRRCTAVLCGLECALISVTVMAVPDIDRRIITDDAVAAILKLMAAHIQSHVLPCFDPLDAYWSKASSFMSSADPGTLSGAGSKAGAGRGKKGKAKAADDGIIDMDEEEDDDGEHAGAGAGAGRATAPVSASTAPIKVTKAMLSAAQEKLKPILLALAAVMERFAPLARAVPLGEELVSRLLQISLSAATQTAVYNTSAAVLQSKGSSSGSSEAAKSALAVSAVGVVHALFELQSSDSTSSTARFAIVSALANGFITAGSSKKYRRGFTVAPSVPKLVSGVTSGSGEQGTGAGSSDVISVHACTAILLHLVHAAAVLPSPAECNAADGVKVSVAEPAADVAAAGKAGKKRKGVPSAEEPVPAATQVSKKERGKKGAAVEEDEDMQVIEETTSSKAKKGKGKASAVAAVENAPSPATGAGKGKKGTSAPVAPSSKPSKRGAKSKAQEPEGEEENDEMEIVPEHAEQGKTSVSTAALVPSSGPVPPSLGYSQCVELAKRYVAYILSWSDAKIRQGGTGTTADEDDPRAVLRRLVEDLLSLLELPEWPAASLLLDLVVRGLRTRVLAIVPPPPAQAGQAPTATPAIQPGTDKVAAHAAGILGLVVPRLLQLRSFAGTSSITLPDANPPSPQGQVFVDRPEDEATMAAVKYNCQCGFGNILGRRFIYCDTCSYAHHFMCVGLPEVDGYASSQWDCDDCVLRKTVLQQQATAREFAIGKTIGHGKTAPVPTVGASTAAGVGAAVAAPREIKGDGDQDMETVQNSPAKKTTPEEDSAVAMLTGLSTVLEQLTLNLVGARSHEDVFSRMARRFLLSKWASAALQRRHALQREYYSFAWELPAKQTFKKASQLSLFNSGRLAVQMVCSEPLLSSTDALLSLVVSMFTVENSKVRTAAMKALADVITADASILTTSPGMLKAVGAMLRDSSKMVRAAALDLIGEHLVSSSASGALLARYAPLLLEKLRDEGTATRKKAVGIFRELLLRKQPDGSPGESPSSGQSGVQELSRPVLLPVPGTHTSPSSSLHVEVLKALLARACDRHEEDSVKDAIAATFSELWFGQAALGGSEGGGVGSAAVTAEDLEVTAPKTKISTTKGTAITNIKAHALVAKRLGVPGGPDSDAARAEMRTRAGLMVALVDSTLTAGKGTHWLSHMLARLLADAEPKNQEGEGPSSTRKKSNAASSAWAPKAVLSVLLGHMMHALQLLGNRKLKLMVAASAEAAGDSARTGGGVGSSATGGDVEESGPSALYARELVAVVATIYICAQPVPDVLAPHLRVLAPLLRGDALLSPARNALLQQFTAGTVELGLVVRSDTPTPTALAAIEADLIDILRTGGSGSHAAMTAAAAALGVLTTVVTGDDSRVRQFLVSLMDRLQSCHAKHKEAAVMKAQKEGKALTEEQASVVWLRELTGAVASAKSLPLAGVPAATQAHAGALKAQLSAVLTALYAAGLLSRYCDLDKGQTAVGTADVLMDGGDVDDERVGGQPVASPTTSFAVHEDKEEEEEGLSDSDGEEQLAMPVARSRQAVAPASSSSDLNTSLPDELAGWSETRGAGAGGTGRQSGQKPLKTFGSAKNKVKTPVVKGGSSEGVLVAREPNSSGASGKKKTPGSNKSNKGSAAVASATPGASSTVSALVPKADTKTEAALPRGGTVQKVYAVLAAYATAALKLSSVVRRTIVTSARILCANGASMTAAEQTERRKQLAAAQALLREVTSVGCSSVRGAGFTFARQPSLALSEQGRFLVGGALTSPMPSLKEAGLRLLEDLLTAHDDRKAVASALEDRAVQDAKTVAAILSTGSQPSASLLASASGSTLQAALLRAPPKALLATASKAAEGSSALSDAAGVLANRVAIERADGTVVEGRAHILGMGDADGASFMLTGVVQTHWAAIKAAVSFAPAPGEEEMGLCDGKAGESVRLASASLLGLVVRQGVRSPDDTISLLMCQAVDEPAIADAAHENLLHIAEQHPHLLERSAVSGIVASYGHQLDVFGVADAREGPPLDAEGEPVDGGRPGPPLLGHLWKSCICRNPSMDNGAPISRGRLNVLRGLVTRMVPDTIPGLHAVPATGLPSSSGPAQPASARAPVASSFLASLGIQSANTAGLRRLEVLAIAKAPGLAGSGAGVAGGSGMGTSDTAQALAPDVNLTRYLCGTLAALPYEREEDILTVAVYANRGVTVHSDALLTSLRRFLPATGPAQHGEAPHQPISLPPPSHPAYAALAVHAAYAYNIACVLRTKEYLKEVWRVPDQRVQAYDPAAPLASRLPDRPLDAAEASGLFGTGQEVQLPDLPPGFVTAVADAFRAVPALPEAAGSGVPGTARSAAGPAPTPVATPSTAAAAPPRVLLTVPMLKQLYVLLEKAVVECCGDLGDALAALPFKKRVAKQPKAAAAGAGEGEAASGVGEKPKKKAAAKKRKSRSGDDEEEEAEGEEGETEYVARPSKRRAAAAAQ